MDNAAAIDELNRALAQFRRRQATAPTPHSAREIAHMQIFAEYLCAAHEGARSDEDRDVLTKASPHREAA